MINAEKQGEAELRYDIRLVSHKTSNIFRLGSNS